MLRPYAQWRLRLCRVFAVALVPLVLMGAAAAETIKIGLTVPLTGLQAGAGKESEAVWRAFARHVNGTPLMRGHTLEVLALDDAFDPARSRENAEQLARQGAAVMTATLGIPTVQAMIPVLERHRIALIGPGSGSLMLRGQSAAIFHVKASFGAEVDRMARLLGTMGLKKVMVIVDDAADRKALLERFSAELVRVSASSGHVVGSAVLPQKGGKAEEVAATAMADQPEVIYVITIPGLAGAVLTQLRTLGYRGFVSAWSPASTESVVRQISAAGAGIIFGTVVPSPTSDRPGIMASFQAFAAAQGVPTSFRAMEIYITGRILVEAVLRAEGGAFTGAKVWKALEGLGDVNVDGWRVRYSATDREGSNFVDTMMLLKDGKFR